MNSDAVKLAHSTLAQATATNAEAFDAIDKKLEQIGVALASNVRAIQQLQQLWAATQPRLEKLEAELSTVEDDVAAGTEVVASTPEEKAVVGRTLKALVPK